MTIFSFVFINDFNNIKDSSPNYASLLHGNKVYFVKKAASESSPLSHNDLTNSAILKKFSQYDGENLSSPANTERKSMDPDIQRYTLNLNDEIKENDIYEVQDIEVKESSDFVRNGKPTRVKNLFNVIYNVF